ncbi:hypothetical protein [Pseudonocardia lacus]|uniref:hypothetical protein n=1 Tax=Pseudonocardia lacus TaxID=2835865 RepID=UPI001BDD8D55|nr:hypothetical protein [Pseudonocardia lacus]
MVEQDFSGDYGYDLADEVRSMVPSIGERVRRTPVTGIRGTAMDPAADGDFGYDMAHEA